MSSEFELSSLNIDLRSSPTAFKFLQDKSFVTGLMGPVDNFSFGCVQMGKRVRTDGKAGAYRWENFGRLESR